MNARVAFYSFLVCSSLSSIKNLANSFDILAASAGLLELETISNISDSSYRSTSRLGSTNTMFNTEGSIRSSGFIASPSLSFKLRSEISFSSKGLICAKAISVSYVSSVVVGWRGTPAAVRPRFDIRDDKLADGSTSNLALASYIGVARYVPAITAARKTTNVTTISHFLLTTISHSFKNSIFLALYPYYTLFESFILTSILPFLLSTEFSKAVIISSDEYLAVIIPSRCNLPEAISSIM